jgi:hypothetical protein
MKNSFKIGFLILGISVSALACHLPKANSNSTPPGSGKTKIDTSQKGIDTAKKAGIDTVKK